MKNIISEDVKTKQARWNNLDNILVIILYKKQKRAYMCVLKYEYHCKSRKYDVLSKLLMQYDEIHTEIYDIDK